MLTDIEIALKSKPKDIIEIANKVNIKPNFIEKYGDYKGKIKLELLQDLKDKPNGKLILVTATNPTPAGEGKTTVTIGLGQALNKLNRKAIVTLREPSLGPVFGIKGGATGGGYSQVIPMEDINLHFTGDMHAITTANNLLAALIDNHIYQGNKLEIDIQKIFFRRCLDMNDRSLRNIVIGIGKPTDGVTRQDGFIITVASEIMAILCLSESIDDLKSRLANILIAFNKQNKPIYAKDINAQGSMTTILKDAIKPNLIQTLENTPAIIHGGPFANIAHGCNSIIATKMALKLSDYCVTEAGFGSDLGAEKFLNIKCRYGKIAPDAIVIVTTVRALKYNGGVEKENLNNYNIESLKKGVLNLEVHIENMTKFNVPILVSINKFKYDSSEELEYIKNFCKTKNIDAIITTSYSDGGDGAVDLAKKVLEISSQANNFKPTYSDNDTIDQKIKKIAKEIYRTSNVEYSNRAKKILENINQLQLNHLPVCIAKTQYSISDKPNLLGGKNMFTLNINDIKINSGAGFIVIVCGDIMTMPGLPQDPASNRININNKGTITGLF